MDTIEFWIWEHATKYGMTKVLRKIKSCFSPIIIPNSWLSALYLRQIKNEWSQPDNKISPNELNALKQSLTSTFKHFIKDLKHYMKISDCIQLDLCCKAAFLVMRSAESKNAVVYEVREKIFPCWDLVIWKKIKDSFGLKDDLIMEDIQQFYSGIRLKLCQIDHEKKILNQFGDMMKKHFPSLISFMQKIKLSKLERIQLNKMKLDKKYEFLRVRLNGGLVNELVVLELLEIIQRKKIIESASKFLKEAKMDEASTDDDSKEVNLYALPPDKFENYDNQMYPTCFLTNPFMSTDIVVENDGILEEMVVRRNIPRKPDGKDFGPHWFSDTRCLVMKTEKNVLTIDRDCFKITEKLPAVFSTHNASISDHSFKSSLAVGDGLVDKKQLNPATEKPAKGTVDDDNTTDFGNRNLQLVSKILVATVETERVNSIQSWIDDNPLVSPSSIENGIFPVNGETKEKLLFSSGIKDNCVLPEEGKMPFEKNVRTAPILPILNPPSVGLASLGEISDPVAMEECRKLYGVLTEYKSSERCVSPSDTEYVSSTTASTSSCRRRQTRYKYLTESANREKRKHHLDKDGDDSSSSSNKFIRRLRSQLGGKSSECFPVRVTRSKRKCRKLSSSSSSSGYSASSKRLQLETVALAVDNFRTSTDSSSEESTEQKKKKFDDRWDGTPPLVEEFSNYHTPALQQDSKCSEDNALELSALTTGIKRKLSLDEESDSPKSKRFPLENLSDGKRILPSILETLQKHSAQLLMNDPLFFEHCEKLDLCILRVLRSHGEKLSISDKEGLPK